MSNHWSTPNGCHAECPACEATNPTFVNYASVGWSAEDVKTLAAGLTDEQAIEWLENNQNHIIDRLVELGWGVLETFLAKDGIELISAEDLEYRTERAATAE
jgi:hypothetical protein